MRILVFGATGPTGRQVVRQALNQGHAVTAFVRNPVAIDLTHERLLVFQGDIFEKGLVEEAVAAKEAVISALGTRTLRGPGAALSPGVKNIVDSMERQNVRRLVSLSAFGVGDSHPQTHVVARMISKFVLADAFADKSVQEKIVRESSLDWTIVRPAALTNGPITGRYRAAEILKTGAFPHISRADVADFMLKQVENETWSRKAVVLAY